MSWLRRTVSSSIGGKYLVALTGLVMVGFLVAHLAGNLLVYAGPLALHDYAEGLRKFPAVLWALRLGLIVSALLHVFLATKLNLANRAARPITYFNKSYRKATYASRSMLLTGILLLLYIVYHLADFTWRWTNADVARLGPYDVYQMLILRLSSPVNALIYMAAMAVMGLHLCHGVTSVFQTVGLNHPKYNFIFRSLGPLVGTILSVGFMSIPISILLGIVH